MPGAIVLLSGGLDSTTCLYLARRDGFDPLYAVSFEYGQRHKVELDRAVASATRAGVERHFVVPVPVSQWGGSALTDSTVAIPKERTETDMGRGIPVTYVPARNTVWLALAASCAEALGVSDIFIGVNALDFSGYPDCRPEFVEAMRTALNLGTRQGVEGKGFTIHAPLVRLTKAEIVLLAQEVGVPLWRTSSCYDPAPDGTPCDACDSCLLRAKGFREAGVVDPVAGV